MSDAPTVLMMPRSVEQAMRDHDLSPIARVAMYGLMCRLSFVTYTPVKAESLARDLGCTPQCTARALRVLVDRGYLDELPERRRPRYYRLPWSRREPAARAA
jgi:hypothetical protein